MTDVINTSIDDSGSERFRFIPYRKRDIVDMCIDHGGLPEQQVQLEQLYHMLSNIFHHEFHQSVEAMKDAYAGVDPDADTRQTNLPRKEAGQSFIELLNELLEKANYEVISEDDLNRAMSESSMFNIRLHVDFDDFSEVLLFCRGVSEKQETIKTWFGLRSKTITFSNYDRVVVYLRFKPDYQQQDGQPPACKGDATLLKLFRNVPKADLEMLFPNTRVGMRLIDKLLIGVPALVGGGVVLTTKLGASLILLGSLIGFWAGFSSQPVELNKTSLMVLLAGLVALGGFLWKQFSRFKNRKLSFMQALTENLYFKNLDNNTGVIHRLANDAEEEECKEALLAYYFLRVATSPMTREALDQTIEAWFLERWQCNIDFEIGDALDKLIKLDLVRESDQGLEAIEIDAALLRLDKRWDDYFDFSEGSLDPLNNSS